jgi:hypothetical protein
MKYAITVQLLGCMGSGSTLPPLPTTYRVLLLVLHKGKTNIRYV